MPSHVNPGYRYVPYSGVESRLARGTFASIGSLYLYCILMLTAVFGIFASPCRAQGGTWALTTQLVGNSTGSGTGSNFGYNPSNGAPATANTDGSYSVSATTQAVFVGMPSATISSNFTYKITLTWQPKNNDPILDPAPSKVYLIYKRTVKATTSASAQVTSSTLNKTSSASSNATATCGDLTATSAAVANAPQGSTLSVSNAPPADIKKDADWKVDSKTVVSGKAVFEFNVTLSANSQSQTNIGITFPAATSSGNASFSCEAYAGRVDMGRHNGMLGTGIEGVKSTTSTDPTFTRWLPLSFSPNISNTPFRRANNSLPDVWGNVNCAYSIRLFLEKNQDINGAGNYYRSVDGKPVVNTKQTPPTYVLIDANGDRLTFNTSFGALTPDVHSTLAQVGNQIVLQNAGPPGSLKEKGRYTYTFSAFGGNPSDPNNPEPALLTSISDQFGNTQTLSYLTGLTDPYLRVYDLTSGRRLDFYRTGNYISRIEAPDIVGSVPAVTTKLTWDTSGHLTKLEVFLGNSVTATSTLTYNYLTNSDAPTKMTRSGVVEYSQYQAAPSKDAFGNPIQRLYKTLYGESTDTSSSTPGATNPSIQGVWTYSFGSHTSFFGGIDARTNTITDPRNNATKITYFYANPDDGNDNGAVRRIDVKPQTQFSGVTGSTTISQRFNPDVTSPSLSEIQMPGPALNASSIVAWQFVHDTSTGNIAQMTDPLQHIWTNVWSGTELQSTTDPTNQTWNFTYTPQGRLYQTIDPASRVQAQFTYNTYGQVKTSVIPAAVSATGQTETTTFEYDATTGDLTSVADGISKVVTGVLDPVTHAIVPGSAFDALGDLLAYSVFPDTGDPATSLKPLTTQFVYDATQTPIRITGPNGTYFSPTINNGAVTGFQVRGLSNQILASVSNLRDTRGRVYSTSDSVGSLFQQRYDSNSNVTRFLDGRANQTTINYGGRNEVTSFSWPGGGSVSVLYFANGQIRQITDERNVVTQFVYDNGGRLTNINLPATPTKNRTVAYDDANRVISITSADGDSITYNYAPIDKRLSSTTTVHQGYTYTVSYTYNPDGTLATMTSPVGLTQYAYDVAKNMSQITNPHGEVTTWQYDKIRRITNQSSTGLGGISVSVDYVFGNTGQAGDTSTALQFVRYIQASVGGQPLWYYSLVRSYLGQIIDQTGGQGSYQVALPPGADYEENVNTFDNRGRLSGRNKLSRLSGVAQTINDTYNADLANNINASGNGWVYNSNNQITSAAARPTLPGATNLTYDLAGNTTRINNQSPQWDAWGQMSGVNPVAPATITAVYTYDLLGRRGTKTVNGVLTTRYLYDGGLLIGEVDVASGQLSRSYTWGAQGLISDRILTGTPQSRFYLFDPEGSTEYLIGPNNTVLFAHARYSAYGAPLYNAVPPTPYAWKGQFGAYTDSETGYVKMGARYYSPAVGRFLSRDPIGYAGGANLYGYCLGDPVNFADVSGGWTVVIGIVVGGAIDAGTSAFMAYMNGASSDEIWRAAGRGFVRGAIVGGSIALLGPAAGACTSWTMAIGVGAAGGAIGNIVDQGFAVYDGSQDNFNWKSLFQATIVGGITGGVMKGVGLLCFDGDTPVQVAPQVAAVSVMSHAGKGVKRSAKVPVASTKAIKNIRVGDVIPARDMKSGKIVYRKVKQVFKRVSDHLITVALADKSGKVVERLKTTRQHPFYVNGKGFVPAGGLAVGNAIVTRAGPTLTVQSVKWQRRAEGYTVYNFEVDSNDKNGEDAHNYFVGTNHGGVLVHNLGPCANGGLFDESELGEMVASQKRWQLRLRMDRPPSHLAEPEAHHELPWEFREWFAERGLNVNDPQYGRWVEGANHDAWTPAYTRAWGRYIAKNPNANKGQVLWFLDLLKVSGKFP